MKRALFLALALAACGPPHEWTDVDREPAREIQYSAVLPRMPDADALEYTLRFPEPHTHYVEVELVVPVSGDSLELAMATWTPGSYLIREYARHVEDVTAATLEGTPLAVDKSRKNRWRIDTSGAPKIVVRYRVYGREMTVRANFIDADLAIINGAATYLTLLDGDEHPHDIRVELPEAYEHIATALPAHPSGDANRFFAPSFDIAVDSPMVIGKPALYEFDVEGVPHVLASFAEHGVWDGERSAADVERLAEVQAELWGVIPYDRYVFLSVLSGGGGGLEHLSSTLMLGDRWATRKRKDYVNWLGLVSHELFHTWNVKRLRPLALGPFDYENEVHTESLWVAEGITSYYDDLLLKRAGLIDFDEYLDKLSGQIEGLQTTPGRLVHSLSGASYDAWIKYYRRDENTQNTSVSYYTKGAVVGWLLDAEIQRATAGDNSLDDVMRLAYERYSGERGYTPAQFRAVAEEVAGRPLDDFFATAVDGTGELDYAPALEYFGLELVPPKPATPPGGKPDATPGWLGADVGGDNRVRRVLRETPAYRAGLNVDDEILAIDGERIDSLDGRLERYRPDATVTLLIARRGRIRELPVTLGKKPDKTWKLRVAKRAGPSEKRRRDAWLRPR